jgi:hypothetical protein
MKISLAFLAPRAEYRRLDGEIKALYGLIPTGKRSYLE